MKKIIGLILTAYLLTVIPGVSFAEESVVDNWNYDVVSEELTGLYSDFPVIIDKLLGQDMELTLHFKYLKNITGNDSVGFILRDMADNTVITEQVLKEGESSLLVKNVENNRNLHLVISENLNGYTNTYNGYITTKFVPTDFPVDIKIGDTLLDNNAGEEFVNVLVKKVGEMPVCNHDDESECDESCGVSGIIERYTAEEMATSFYSSLDENSIYEMQVQMRGQLDNSKYRAFVSTFPNGETLGIFTPGYTFSLENPNVLNADELILIPGESSYELNSQTPTRDDYDFTDCIPYITYENLQTYNLTGSSEYIIKWVVPTTGDYTIETIGGVDPIIYEFTVNTQTNEISENPRIRNSGGTGGNISYTVGLAAGVTKYFVWTLEQGSSGASAFRIKRYKNEQSVPSYRDEVQQTVNQGDDSPIDNIEAFLEYGGDIHIYGYNVVSGVGYLVFDNVDYDLSVEISEKVGVDDGVDQLWTRTTLHILETPNNNTSAPTKQIEQWNFSSGVNYIDIYQREYAYEENKDNSAYFDDPSCHYDFYFYAPNRKDSLDETTHGTYGDTGAMPVNITLPYVNETRTLHKGDSDWFEFTAGPNDKAVRVTLKSPNNSSMLYRVNLQSDIMVESTVPPLYYESEELGEVLDRFYYEDENNSCMSQILTYTGLTEDKKYYIEVEYDLTYSSYHPYTIEVETYPDIPSAILNGDTVITYHRHSGETAEELIEEFMENITCYMGETEIADSVAASDIEVWSVMHGNVMNTEYLRGYDGEMTEVYEHELEVRYKGVMATGGSVTLRVQNVETASAVLNGNVNLYYTIGENTDITPFMNTIMNNLTCYINGVEISDSVALSDIEVWAPNQEHIFNSQYLEGFGLSMEAPLQVKFRDVLATGGTVTLIVSEPQTDEIAEINMSTPFQATFNYDALQCAKSLADYALSLNGLPASTYSIADAMNVFSAELAASGNSRLNLSQTHRAAELFYSNGTNQDINIFIASDVPDFTTEEVLYEMLAAGYPVLLQLADVTDADNTEKMRYLIITGVNKTAHQLRIYDPTKVISSQRNKYYPTNTVINGGYVTNNSNVKFSGVIINLSLVE